MKFRGTNRLNKRCRFLFLFLDLVIGAIEVPAQQVSSQTYQWQNVAIVGGGFVTGIIFSTAERNLIYARTDIGGTYRWEAALEQ